MPSSKEYLHFILEQLSPLKDVTYKPMMGEFLIYYRGKLVGGIYDDRLLVKPVKSAIAYLPQAEYFLPYEDYLKQCMTTCLCRKPKSTEFPFYGEHHG